MRLADADPRWIESLWDALRGIKFGVSFRCPHCSGQRLPVFFDPPILGGRPDGLAPDEVLRLNGWAAPKAVRVWQRTGETFDTLTLTPSIDHKGHWHGHITNGEITP